MNLGAEPKKTAVLAGLGLVGAYVFYTNVFSSGPEQEVRKTMAPTAVAHVVPVVVGQRAARKVSSRVNSGEFRPKLPIRPEDRPNYATIDPTLRLDLLAKVQAVESQGGSRSLFQFATAPPPEEKGTLIAGNTKIVPTAKRFGPEPPPKPGVKPPPPPEPPPPPITLKFYGFSAPRPDGTKRAFFLDGDDIFVASEGELVKKRYRLVRIGVNSVVMEDTQFKNNRQTLILQPEQAS